MKVVPIRSLQVMLVLLFFYQTNAFASSCFKLQPTTGGWTSEIAITNSCGNSVDLQNAVLEFQSNQPISGNYWGNFADLSYPQKTEVLSEKSGDGYLIKMPLGFPEGNQWWKPKSSLDANKTIKLQFSSTPQLQITNLAFYPMNEPEKKNSQITINLPANPTSLTTLPEITVTNGSDYTKTIKNASWSSNYVLSSVPYGQYNIQVQSIKDNAVTWQGSAIPAQVTLNSQQGTSVNVLYQQMQSTGQIAIQMPATAPEASLNNPVLHIKNKNTGQVIKDQTLQWGEVATIPDLNAGQTYQLSASTLQGKRHSYNAAFSPSSEVIVQANQLTTVSLTYNGQALKTESVKATINGLPSGGSATITAEDNYGYQYTKTLANGSHTLWALPVNRQYQVKAATVTMGNDYYKANVEPNSFLLETGQQLTLGITYQKEANATKFSPYVDVTLGTITRWDGQTSSMQPIGLLEVARDSGVKSFHLAFVTARNGCEGTWAGYPVSTDPNGFGVPVFKQLKEQGVSLTVAFGGLSGQYLAQACDTDQALADAYEKVITAYNPDVLDFDVENNMQMNNVQLDRMMKAIKIIQSKYPDKKISFTLPVLPSGLVVGVGENVIKRAAANGLDDYNLNIMAMDYGPSFQAKSMGEYGIDALKNTFQQLKALHPDQSDEVLWHRMEITPMIGLNDTIPLNFSLEDVDTLKKFAEEKNIGLLSYWSITRDHPCDSSYVSITCSSKNPSTGTANQQEDYEYAKRFMK